MDRVGIGPFAVVTGDSGGWIAISTVVLVVVVGIVIVWEKVVENGAKVDEDVEVELSFISMFVSGTDKLLFKLSWLPQQKNMITNEKIFFVILNYFIKKTLSNIQIWTYLININIEIKRSLNEVT